MHRSLQGHKGMSARDMLAEISKMPEAENANDHYGAGEYINGFEQRVANLLGKVAAVFMPSGTMCQQIALRIHCDRRNGKNVAFHPTCHLEIHEENAYRRLHGLNGVLVGSRDSLITLADLERVREPLSALLVELPQREIGGQLPSWDDLSGQISWAKERNIATHLDGARLWECKPHLGRDYPEICALFDTVYVSFYKILFGISGAILAGPADVIREARLWQRRHGGNPPTLYPMVLAAQRGLDRHLGRISEYVAKAREIAGALKAVPDLTVLPDPPHTNMMHVFIKANVDAVKESAQRIGDETQVALSFGYRPADIPGWTRFEWTFGEAALEFTSDEILKLISDLLHRSNSSSG